jgi:hypothetical protein
MRTTHKDLAYHNARALGNGVVCKKHLQFQKILGRCKKTSLYHDCTIATPPHRFNPMTRYNCCPAHTHELTAKAPEKMFAIRV